MYAYALVVYFDYETEKTLKKLWTDLASKGITRYGVETKGKRPHITIADYYKLEKNKFIDLLDKFHDRKKSIEIELSTLGTFINTATLFLAPMLSEELYNFHREYHNYFELFNDNEKSFYIPGRWNPHCTIASRLSEDNMMQAFKYCRNNISKIYGKINEVALLEIKLNNNGIVTEDTVIFSKKLK